MAKTLHTPTPSSSIARLLDPVAAAQATQRVGAIQAHVPDAQTADFCGTGCRLDRVTAGPIKREIVLTPETDATLDRIVRLYRAATHTRVSTSQVVRAMLLGVAPKMQQLQYHANQLGPQKLPGNAPNSQTERDEFENRLAVAFVAGLCEGSDSVAD